MSYVARNCYLTNLEYKAYKKSYFEAVPDFPTLAAQAHDNTNIVFNDLNTLGLDSLLKFYAKDWTAVSYDVSRITYLLALQ